MQAGPKNVGHVLKAGADYLAGKGVEHPRLVCELLLGRLLGCKRLELPLKARDVLPEPRLAAMRRGLKRVAAGEPVQYIVGRTEFMGHTFKVDPRALIPRPETECLVEAVLEFRDPWERGRPAVVDVGTGCGCIVISLARARPEGWYIGLDVSAGAVELARENSEALGVSENVAFAVSSLPDTVEPETIDIIVANAPYIPTADCETLPRHIRDHEPRAALDGGPDGLAVIQEIAEDAAIALKPGGALFLEIGERQADAVRQRLAAQGFADITVRPDLAGRDRIVSCVLPGLT
jgi:release factor glutamine methyltransferase